MASDEKLHMLAAKLTVINEHYFMVCDQLGRREGERYLEKHSGAVLSKTERRYRRIYYRHACRFAAGYLTLHEALGGFRKKWEEEYGLNPDGDLIIPDKEADLVMGMLDDFFAVMEEGIRRLEIDRLTTLFANSPDDSTGGGS
jgi:hypothetical protein